MAKKKKPEQAIFYQNFKGAIYGGTDSQVKRLMVAFCQYAFDNVLEPQIDDDIAMSFAIMRESIDADRKHYMDVCEQNRINGLKRTGYTITGTVQKVRVTNDTVTFEVDDEEYCFNRADIGDALMEIVVGDFVEIDFKNGKHIAIRTATQLG